MHAACKENAEQLVKTRSPRLSDAGMIDYSKRPLLCSVDNCDREAKSKGWCIWHYYRQYHGLPLVPECRDCRAEMEPKRGVQLCPVCVAHGKALREEERREAAAERTRRSDARALKPWRGLLLAERECELCDRPYKPTSSNQKYCTKRCAKRAGRRHGTSSDRAKRLVSEYKEILGCENCGLEGPACIFDPHHVDPTTKEFGLSSAPTPTAAWEEFQKCVNLCAVCHRLVEAGHLSL